LARSTTAIAPAGSGPYGSHPSFTVPSGGGAAPSFTRTIVPLTPAFVAGGPNRAQPAPKSPTPVTETWFWSPKVVMLPGHRNICIRGTPVPGVGSVGVEKLALFVPDPSWASQRT
jgi:hypothetical protein